MWNEFTQGRNITCRSLGLVLEGWMEFQEVHQCLPWLEQVNLDCPIIGYRKPEQVLNKYETMEIKKIQPSKMQLVFLLWLKNRTKPTAAKLPQRLWGKIRTTLSTSWESAPGFRSTQRRGQERASPGHPTVRDLTQYVLHYMSLFFLCSSRRDHIKFHSRRGIILLRVIIIIIITVVVLSTFD